MSLRQRLLQLDAHYSDRLSLAENPGLLQNFARFFAHSGDSWFWILGLALLWLFGNDFWKLRAAIMLAGILLTAIIVFTIKFSVRRQRPEGEWGAIYRQTDPHSFPSGHSTRAMMLAVVAVGLGPAWFGILLVIWAPLVVLARVAMGVHYLSDVLAGAAMGIAIGLIILRLATLI